MNENERKARNLRLIIADSEAWLDETKFREQVEKFCNTHIELATNKFVAGGYHNNPDAEFEMGAVKKLQDLVDAFSKAAERKSKAIEELKKYDA